MLCEKQVNVLVSQAVLPSIGWKYMMYPLKALWLLCFPGKGVPGWLHVKPQSPIIHRYSLLIHMQKMGHNFFQVNALGLIYPFMCPVPLEVISTKLQKVSRKKYPCERFVLIQLCHIAIRVYYNNQQKQK